MPDYFSVLAEEFAIGGGKYICRRRRWPEDVAKAVDLPAFEIDAGEQRSGNALSGNREAVAMSAPEFLCSARRGSLLPAAGA